MRDLSLRGERSHLGEFTGNVDALDNGDWLVSWGGIFGGGCRVSKRRVSKPRDGHVGRSRDRSGEAGHPLQGVAHLFSSASHQRDRGPVRGPGAATRPAHCGVPGQRPHLDLPHRRRGRAASGRRLQPARGGLQRLQPVDQRPGRHGRERRPPSRGGRAGQRLCGRPDARRRWSGHLQSGVRPVVRILRRLHGGWNGAVGGSRAARDPPSASGLGHSHDDLRCDASDEGPVHGDDRLFGGGDRSRDRRDHRDERRRFESDRIGRHLRGRDRAGNRDRGRRDADAAGGGGDGRFEQRECGGERCVCGGHEGAGACGWGRCRKRRIAGLGLERGPR